MQFVNILGIAVALAMDAFAVAVATGVSLKYVSFRQTFRLSWHFGLFQAIMPVIGWSAGLTIRSFIEQYDHWVAFGLLAFVGGHMIKEAFQPETDKIQKKDPTKGLSLVMLSVATSIDALAVGLSLSFIEVRIVFPAVLIGIVAGLMSLVGVRLGERVSGLFGARMELVGGVVLILIGVRIVLQHTGWV